MSTTNFHSGLPALVPVGRSKPAFGWSRSTSYRLAAAGKLRIRKIGAGAYVETTSALELIKASPLVQPKGEAA
jgi:hypothetical protein